MMLLQPLFLGTPSPHRARTNASKISSNCSQSSLINNLNEICEKYVDDDDGDDDDVENKLVVAIDDVRKDNFTNNDVDDDATLQVVIRVR